MEDNKLNKNLPPVFYEIAKRYAVDFGLAHDLYFESRYNFDLKNLPVSLLKQLPGKSDIKEMEKTLFKKILDDVIKNDKTLQNLLRTAEIGIIKYRKK